MVFARPLTILFLLPIIEKKWVTPNRLTVMSVFTKLVGIYLIAFKHTYSAGIWGAVLINLGLILDNMDGTVARYRLSGTSFGYYFDKATDAVTLVLLFWAMGYRAYLHTGSLIDLMLPQAGIIGAFIANYSKWVAETVFTSMKLKQLLPDKEKLFDYAKARTTQKPAAKPPKRGFFDWIKFFGWAILSILFFNEVDIYFWCAVALITGKYWIFTVFNSGFLALGLLAGPILFAVKIYRMENKDAA